MTTWTEKEIALLVNCYKTEGAARCATALNRSISSVTSKVKQLREAGVRFKGTHTLDKHFDHIDKSRGIEIRKNLNEVMSMCDITRNQLYGIWQLHIANTNPTTIAISLGLSPATVVEAIKQLTIRRVL